MTKRKKPRDRFAKREAENYQNPIASRELIRDVLKVSSQLAAPALAKQLQLSSEVDLAALEKRLRAMVRDGQLQQDKRGRFSVPDDSKLITGRVQVHRDGYGFLIPEQGGDDYYLHNRQLASVFDGDIVQAVPGGPGFRGLQEAKIIEIVERKTTRVVGRYTTDRGMAMVQPDNPRIHHLIKITEGEPAKFGEYVVAEITIFPDQRQSAEGRIVEVLGDHLTPGLETEIAIRSHDIPHEWPEDLIRYAASLPSEPDEQDKQHRVDLRSKPFITIDGEDARDFDDAVYCEAKTSGGWRLWVAIADVSHYVQVGSMLDREAWNRGTSVYFPDRVVPMLPEAISNGLCSLKPDVDRLCMVCEMTVSATGKLSSYQFYEAVMHSHARLTYNQVWKMLLEKQAEDAEQDSSESDTSLRQHYSHVIDSVDNLHSLYSVLRAARDRRGAIDFETVETRMIFNEQGKIDSIVPVVRNDAHKLIEECMLLANVAAARLLTAHKVPALFRVHQGPTEEKLQNLREFLADLNLVLSGGDDPSPGDYQKILEQVEDRPDANIIQTMLLRSMRQAMYQPANEGHFGLAFKAYAHFTSPIRRYPDLLVHRAIRSLIRSGEDLKSIARVESTPVDSREIWYPYDFKQMLAHGEHCSMTERRADEASRDVVNALKCEFLSQHVGDVFEGTITSVAGFGLFVEMDDIYIEGLIHVTELGNDYYQFDKARQQMVGERTGTIFRLGDRLTVRIAKVDMDEKKIDLILEEEQRTPRRRSANGNKTRNLGAKAASGKETKKANNTKSAKGKNKSGMSAKKKDVGKSATKTKRKPSKKHDKRMELSKASSKKKKKPSKPKKASVGKGASAGKKVQWKKK